MHPETFLRVLGPKPWSVAYVQPSRRPADGRFGENPNRLFKHQQFQGDPRPAPDEVQQLYLQSLEACGIDLRAHDCASRNNWESPTLGAWGIGWQVLFDGQEDHAVHLLPAGRRRRPVTDLRGAHLRDRAVCDGAAGRGRRLRPGVGAGVIRDVRHRDEVEQSKSRSGQIDLPANCTACTGRSSTSYFMAETLVRSNLLPALDYCLKCSHMFNLLDSSGGIGVTERMAYIPGVRTLAVSIAKEWAGGRVPEDSDPEEARADGGVFGRDDATTRRRGGSRLFVGRIAGGQRLDTAHNAVKHPSVNGSPQTQEFDVASSRRRLVGL